MDPLSLSFKQIIPHKAREHYILKKSPRTKDGPTTFWANHHTQTLAYRPAKKPLSEKLCTQTKSDKYTNASSKKASPGQAFQDVLPIL